MQLSNSRLLAVTVVSGLFALVAALPALAGSTKAHGTTVNVTISKSNDFKFILSKKSVPHGSITFVISNGGNLPHDFQLCSKPSTSATATKCAGKKTPSLISPGQSGKLPVTVSKPGTYEYMCTVPGHAAAGMTGLLKVT